MAHTRDPPLQEACTFGSRLGNRSVFILDPRLMFMFCFLLLFQPGHLAIPEAYTRPPDLLPHRTDLTIQDTVSSLNSLAAYLVFHRYNILTTNAYSLLILGNQTYHSAPLGVKIVEIFYYGPLKKEENSSIMNSCQSKESSLELSEPV